MKKRIFSMLLSLCMVLALLPVLSMTAMAAGYGVNVCGVAVTDENASGVTGTGITGTVTYDAASNTLTLTNATLDYTSYAITAGSLTIELVGENSITVSDNVNTVIAIATTSTLNFTGGGSLTVEVITGSGTNEAYGIHVLSGTGCVNVQGGTLDITVGNAAVRSCGVYAGADVTVEGGSTLLDTTAGEAEMTYGILANGGDVHVYDESTVIATGGSCDDATPSVFVSSFGIYAGAGNVEVTDGATVTATGGDASSEAGRFSYGICVAGEKSVIIHGADTTVTATGGRVSAQVGGSSYGIFCASDVQIMNGATVTATGGEASTEAGAAMCSYGIYASNVRVSSSTTDTNTVTVTGGDASTMSYGIYVRGSEDSKVVLGNNLVLTIAHGTGTSVGGISAPTCESSGKITFCVSAEDTLKEALNLCVDGNQTVKLMGNIITVSRLEFTKSANLDLNGYVLQRTNAVAGSGGNVIYVNHCNLTLKDSNPTATHSGDYAGLPSGGVITGGNAARGGGVYIGFMSKFTMEGGTITNCTATENGGGVYMAGDGEFTMKGGTISDCTATQNGGGVYNEESTVRLINTSTTGATICYGTLYNNGRIEDHLVEFKIDDSVYAWEVVANNGKAVRPTKPTKTGFVLAGWYEKDDEGAFKANAFDFDTTITADTTLYAKWECAHTDETPDYCVIKATAGEGGSITPSGRAAVLYGASKTFTITPNDGYAIADVKVDGKSVGAVKTYTFERVRGDHTIEAVFMKASAFTDVSENDWFYEDVAYVYGNDLMKGTSETTFSPNVTTTRGMIVTILYRLEGEPTVSDNCPFEDVKSGSYYEKAIIWAAENRIVGGYGNGKFGPDDPITREQLAAILYRYMQYKKLDVTVGEDTNILSYNDALEISEYAFSAMQWICGESILNGSDGNLMPQGNATRAQVAAILHRFCENILK